MNETQRLTTTLNLLRKANACPDRYEHLLRALGGTSYDHDAPINLLTILEHNGVDDCLWSLGATAENCDLIARLMAADFAEAVLPLYEREHPTDRRPRAAIEAARAYARGEIEAATAEAQVAAARAAWTAWAAARAAAEAATREAARTAAGEAAWAAAWEAPREATRAVQADIIRRFLLPDEVEHGI